METTKAPFSSIVVPYCGDLPTMQLGYLNQKTLQVYVL